jgi:hypothetical protein
MHALIRNCTKQNPPSLLPKSNKRIRSLRAIPLHPSGPPLPLNPTRRPTTTHNHTPKHLALPHHDPHNRIRPLAHRLLYHPLDRLIPRAINRACDALRLAPSAAKTRRDVLDEGFCVFAREARGAVHGSRGAQNDMAGQGGARGCEERGCARGVDFGVEG